MRVEWGNFFFCSAIILAKLMNILKIDFIARFLRRHGVEFCERNITRKANAKVFLHFVTATVGTY